jgi:hypothetical protein
MLISVGSWGVSKGAKAEQIKRTVTIVRGIQGNFSRLALLVNSPSLDTPPVVRVKSEAIEPSSTCYFSLNLMRVILSEVKNLSAEFILSNVEGLLRMTEVLTHTGFWG